MLPWNLVSSPRFQPCNACKTTQPFSKFTKLWQQKPKSTSSWNLPREVIFTLRSARLGNSKNQPHVVTFNNLCLPSTSATKMVSLTAISSLIIYSLTVKTACGTPAFTAPEVMSRQGYDGAKADAWSCGVILFFLLSAYLPFDDSNLAFLYKRAHKGEYQVPSCISKPVKSIINQLLDPNPNTRMSMEALMKHSWFLKKFELPTQSSVFELDYKKYCKFDQKSAVACITAFDIISLSSGLDLSRLFEVKSRKERRFTSSETVERVTERLREVGGRLGYRVVEGKGGSAIGLGKGRVGVLFEVFEIAEKLLVVEVKMVEGGGVEFEEVHWGELKDELEDVVLQWHNGVM
ncbi:hypothetical protein NC652_021701 [Populus alba x Populus x berolinensis]|nr:hypothetical protein NC652_021701 [Populus alba x Populus x berolinensis]